MDQQQTTTEAPTPAVLLFPVEGSSRILAAGYNEEAKILAMQFKDNPHRTYRYQDVPPAIWDGFNKAQSKGAYFYGSIFKQFGFERVEADGFVSKIEVAPQQNDEPEAA